MSTSEFKKERRVRSKLSVAATVRPSAASSVLVLLLAFAAAVALVWGASPAWAQAQSCPSDGVITSGGVYSGCVWERTQDTNPAVTIKTAQAVT